ncbi:MAG: 4-hydroxy-3-methylbut-2-enyl diphosphate reductase [Bacteroidales bacterium]|jgi:4-hydroxy-3-methylbut-2-enyl diphosphate reductase|nr:4-hydroxy-3-methylbut-2-enyl diphosphate reductase [Bacteroidales bacterium]
MKIDIEPGSGFCFGVENAVNIAEESLSEGEKVYCLGEIVHNDIEVNRLKDLGLVTISYEEFTGLKDCKVLVRAHGEPPTTYETARKNNITIIDATCPIVHSLQDKIKRALALARLENGQIAIFGKEGHAEVIGLLGAANGLGILITRVEDLDKIDFTKPVWLFSQTTKSTAEYNHISEVIEQRLRANRSKWPGNHLKVHNTICRQVSGREPKLKVFVRTHDVIIFVSGRKSSNGKMLYDVCLAENRRSYFISSADEINPLWFSGAESIGVCGATSTPRWLIRQIAEEINMICQKHGI